MCCMAIQTAFKAPVSVALARRFIAAVANATTYVVVAGDTGNVIAGELGVTLQQLEDANPGVNWDALQIGRILQVPGHSVAMRSYTVVAGDTLSIASRFGTDLAGLIDLNAQLCKLGTSSTSQEAPHLRH
jgi:N-acetylmuramoyl-L-alanine amidase